jgi:predicted methyltransferase
MCDACLQALRRESDIWQAAGACERPFPRFIELIEALQRLGYIEIHGAPWPSRPQAAKP